MKKRLLHLTLSLFLSFNLFSQWEPKALGTLPNEYFVSDISIVNDQIIWAVAIDFSLINPPTPANHLIKLMKSTNGGDTWEVKDIGDAIGRFSLGIHAFDENTACITTQNYLSPTGRGVFRTTDGGDSWDEVHSGNDGGLWIHFFDDQEGVCINGFSGYRGRTTDGGVDWATEPILDFQPGEKGVFESPSSSIAILGDNLWFGTNQGRVFKSSDRGQTWNTTPMNLGGNFIYSMAFVDEQNGLALHATNYQLAKTTDGGATWAPVDYDYDFIEVIAIPCSNIFMGVSYDDNITAISTDWGETWELKDNSISAWVPTFKSPNLGWMAEGTLSGPGNPTLYKWIGEPLNGRIYVNKNAIGANDGTSWADAYTDLQVALAAAETGDEIWVAEGTYLPGSDPTATFLINKDLKLYGGFAGTECNLSERDIVAYPTVLSGDLDSNDMEDDFATNREDNVMTVVTVYANTSEETLIDGFTIANGHADGVSNNQQRNGAGIFSTGATQVKNCVFIQNYAQTSGGGLYFSGPASRGAIVENCRFETNRADNTFDAGGGMYVGSVTFDGVKVNHCEFIENISGRGSGLAAYNSNIEVKNSSFLGNDNIRQGGGMWFWGETPSVTVEVDSCTFNNNHSSFGGGMYAFLGAGSGVNIRNSTFNGNSVTPNNLGWGQGGAGIIIITGEPNTANAFAKIENTQFFGNNSTNIGGGIYLNVDANNFDFKLSNCNFNENVSGINGGGVWMQSYSSNQGNSFKIDDCEFEKNSCLYNGSALFSWLSGVNDVFELTNSQILENTADSASAAVDFWGTDGGTGTVLVDRCLFDGNSSWWSGALEMGNGWNGGASISYTLSRSTFTNNQSMEAGALTIWETENSNTEIVIDSCQFDNNLATDRGGAMSVLAYGNHFNAMIKRSTITNNKSPKGAAIDTYSFAPDLNFPDDNSIHFENTLISGNIGDRAAINLDSTKHWSFLNCTIAGNQSNGIELENESSIALQNTILANPGYDEFVALTTDVTVTSLGGNLFGDGSFATHALTYDKQNTDPLFVGGGDYHLTDDSPAIDKGVDLGNLPPTDLDGNDRPNGCVDIGAYESDVIVSMDCITSTDEAVIVELVLSPNPATDFIQLHLPESTTQPNEISLFDAQGRLVEQRAFSSRQTLLVGHLPSGLYTLKVTDGEQGYIGRFIKQ